MLLGLQIFFRHVYKHKLELNSFLEFSRILICVISLFNKLSLSLFVFRVFANNSNYTFSFYYFAFVADFLYRWSYFHFLHLLFVQPLAYIYNHVDWIIFLLILVLLMVYTLIFYFALHIIRPLVKSYGESSTFTLSPGRIFI